MSSFRKRKSKVLNGGVPHFTYRVTNTGDDVIVTGSLTENPNKDLPPAYPSLDEMLSAGVAVKPVPTDGILDSYDANDIPNLENVIDDCINDVKSAKSKSKSKKVNE